MTKRQTQEGILERYRTAAKLNKSDFAELLGVSRQSYHLWLDGTEIRDETLKGWAINKRGGMVGEMAVELLRARKSILPCVCNTEVMDNGFCPKHSKVIYKVGVI